MIAEGWVPLFAPFVVMIPCEGGEAFTKYIQQFSKGV